MQSWEKERQISKESPSSPILQNRNVPPQSSPHDLMAKSNFPPDFKKKYEQWQKIKGRIFIEPRKYSSIFKDKLIFNIVQKVLDFVNPLVVTENSKMLG